MPHLTMINADGSAGPGFEIRPGGIGIGRVQENGIVVAASTVSRHHAYLQHRDGQVVLSDLGSVNGTWVNGWAVHGPVRLGDGDRVTVGGVDFVFSGSATVGWSNSGRISSRGGHINAGNGHQQIGDNIHHESHDEYNLDLPDPANEIVAGRGIGRGLTIIGVIIAFAGFAGWMFVIFSGMASVGDQSSSSPLDLELVDGVPLAPAAFAAAAFGAVLSSLGVGMSRNARKRQERAERNRRRGDYYR